MSPGNYSTYSIIHTSTSRIRCLQVRGTWESGDRVGRLAACRAGACFERSLLFAWLIDNHFTSISHWKMELIFELEQFEHPTGSVLALPRLLRRCVLSKKTNLSHEAEANLRESLHIANATHAWPAAQNC